MCKISCERRSRNLHKRCVYTIIVLKRWDVFVQQSQSIFNVITQSWRLSEHLMWKCDFNLSVRLLSQYEFLIKCKRTTMVIIQQGVQGTLWYLNNSRLLNISYQCYVEVNVNYVPARIDDNRLINLISTLDKLLRDKVAETGKSLVHKAASFGW